MPDQINLGYKSDPADEDDLSLATDGIHIPPSVDFRDSFVLRNQKQDPACVGFSLAHALRASVRIDGADDFEVSPYAIWYWARSLEGEEELSDGTHIRTALKALMKLGIPAAKDFEGLAPHRKIPPHNKAPGARVLVNAYKYRGVRGYYRVSDNNGIRAALAQGKLVVFGIDVNRKFLEKRDAAAIDVFADAVVGGHAMAVAGYEPDETFWWANSMGIGWGEDGFAKATDRMMARSRDKWAIDVNPNLFPRKA